MPLEPADVLDAWDWPEPVTPVATSSGLINASWLLQSAGGGTVAVLQRLNTRVFRATVHEDIAAITAELHAQDLPTPRLITTRMGELYVELEGAVWRALTPVGSRTIDTVTHPDEARSAGALVARFHGALAGFQWTFRHVRPGAHDTDGHLRTLQAAVDDQRHHRLHAPVARLAEELAAAWSTLRSDLPELPTRVIHGDLKLSNVRFDGREAVALIDLDTMAYGTLDVELGDALRSWCGAAGEDVAEASFDLEIFTAAMTGYASARGPWGPTAEEWQAIVPGTQRIATELAMRFAADALNERYFGWDRARFPAAGEHNLLRARGQASLARAVALARAEAERRLGDVLGR